MRTGMRAGFADVVRMLLAADAAPNEALRGAASRGDADAVRTLLNAKGVDVSSRDAEGVFFEYLRSMPTANAEDARRSEGT